MSTPNNAAAEQIIRAHSIITDLTTQQAEVSAAIPRQLDLIEALMPVAEWGTAGPEGGVDVPEPEASVVE